MKLHIHIYNHSHDHNDLIINKLNTIMATQEQFQVQLDRIQASIDKLTANAGGLNVSQEDATLATLTAKADALDQLANPAPPTP